MNKKENKRLYDINYRKKNKIKKSLWDKRWYIINRERILNLRKLSRKKYPEKYILKDIRNRCTNLKNKEYHRYGGRGIKNFLTIEDIKFLIERDGYWNLNKPSIDRKDNDGDYTLDNCQFIEFNENKAKEKRKPILQFDLNGNFIREWNSIIEASKFLNITHCAIIQNLKNKSKSSAGFRWRYKIAL